MKKTFLAVFLSVFLLFITAVFASGTENEPSSDAQTETTTEAEIPSEEPSANPEIPSQNPEEPSSNPGENTDGPEEPSSNPGENTDGPEEYEKKLMGDVDFDGVVSSADARAILRYAVSLEDLSPEAILYANIDIDDIVSSADARLALRVSVGLEPDSAHALEVVEYVSATCSEQGLLKAVCKCCDTEVSMVTTKEPHTLVKDSLCDNFAVCSVCSAKISVAPQHDFDPYGICTRCDFVKKSTLFNVLKDVAKTFGELSEGVYVYGEEFDEYYVSLCYSPKDDTVYMYTLMVYEVIDAHGIKHYGAYHNYLDLENTFSYYKASMSLEIDDTVGIYMEGELDEATAHPDGPGAFRLTHYEAIQGVPDSREEVAVLSEGMSLAGIDWLLTLCDKHGIPLTAEIMGFANF